jgi:Leucine-rich repeat (LRR) protein
VKWPKTLVTLQLAGNDLAGSNFVRLKIIPRLSTLDLEFCSGIDDLAVAQICELQNLRHLDVSHTDITQRGVRKLRNLPKLEDLELYGAMVAPED